MKAYLLSVTGVVLLSAALSLILPNGKTGKMISGMLKLVFLFTLLSPFLNVWGGNWEEYFENCVLETDEEYLFACASRLSAEDEAEICRLLREEYLVESAVSVQRKGEPNFPMTDIFVKITDYGILSADEHIDIVCKIEERLSACYGCRVEVS